ncbi:MBL fold metallo-hydrolase [Clostridium sp. CTA-7]
MQIIQVRENTFCIDTGMTYIPFYRVSENNIVMIDTGLAKGERGKLDRLLEENSFNIVGIICSHAHIDHIGNASYFKEKYKCQVAMSETEAFICSSIINLKMYYCDQSLDEIEEYFGHMVCKVDIVIKENDYIVNIAGSNFKILHTPGHSAAHICITTPDDVSYLGDTLISYEVMKGAKMPYAFILKEDLKSKEKLHSLKGIKYIVAHKGIYDNITELIEDNINFYKDRANKICELIDMPMTKEDVIKKIVKEWKIGIRNIRKYIVIERMLKSYIEYLNETKKIEIILEDGFLKYSKL